jgi:hypothetical protein
MVSAMNEFNHDSYCGIYCGACDIMMAYKTGHKDAFAAFWSGPIVKAIQKSLGIKYDDTKPVELKCHGCKTGSLFVNCKSCEIRTCDVEKKSDHCAVCSDYPCKIFSGFTKMGKLLPHLKQIAHNTESIKKVGVERWLSEQEKRWKCPECQAAFAWYFSRCNNCGGDLRQYASLFGTARSILLKLGTYLSSLGPRDIP